MTSLELSEWQAFAELEPFGDIRADWRIAQLSAMFLNVNRTKEAKPANVIDFMWLDDDARPKSEQSDSEMMRRMKQAAKGGR